MATRSIALVEDAGAAITEAVRQMARTATGGIVVRAWFDAEVARLRVELVDRDGPDFESPMPAVAALASGWGAERTELGATVWFEMQPRGEHRPHGRSA